MKEFIIQAVILLVFAVLLGLIAYYAGREPKDDDQGFPASRRKR